MTLEQTIRVFARGNLTAQPIKEYLTSLQLAGMEVLEPTSLVRRHLTGTAQASERPFSDEPEPLGLPYQEGHTVSGEDERRAVVQAAGPFTAVGSANDAQRNGVPYVIFIERKDKSHEQAHGALLPVLKAAAPEAWRKAQKGSHAA